MIDTDSVLKVDANIRPDYFLTEYDDILMGRRRTFSAALNEQGPTLCAELLRKIFAKYLNWTPEEIRDDLTPEIVKTMKIGPLVKKIPCPPEINRSKDLYYVAWYLYPETRTLSEPELIIKLYKDILNGDVKRFPEGYFDGSYGYLRAKILFLTMVREYMHPFESIEALYAYFASPKGEQCLTKYRLNVPLRELYDSALDYLHDALPSSQSDDALYEKYKDHSSCRILT